MIRNCYIGMWILIISLVLLGVIALIAGIIRNKRLEKKIEKGELDRMPVSYTHLTLPTKA